MSGVVDPRRAALLVAAAALIAAAVVLPALGAEPEATPGLDHAAAAERSARHGPDPEPARPAHPDATGRTATRTETTADASEAPGGAAATVPRRDREPAAHDPATAPAALPGTVRADNPPDPATLAAAREVAAAWVHAFATLDPEGDDAWLARLRPHSTDRLLAAFAHPATAETGGPLPGSVRVLAAELGPATADRIGVCVRFVIDPDPAEHALEVVVVPNPDGPRVDEVRL